MKSFLRYVVTCAGFIALVVTPAWALDTGDAEQGHELAKETCAQCHGIEKGYEASPEPFAPTFEAVANSPGMSALAISVFLRTPHATMPNLVLKTEEIEDIVAYITSMKE